MAATAEHVFPLLLLFGLALTLPQVLGPVAGGPDPAVIEFVRIPAGTFTMTCRGSRPE